ncbi:MAG TPA: FUSC family protein [Micromonosporaceae bacterium]|jgi:uncharacterized membrane protein YgaE (UPF0421/DUF939 family)
MATARDHALNAADTLGELRQRSARDVSDRLRRLRANVMLIAQSGLAAGLAWYVAHNLIGHKAPFFAPVSAVIVLGVAVGQRWRRALELVFGVALGIGIGDTLIYVIGTGPWQIALVVMLAIGIAVFLGGSPTVVSQTASSAVLVATLATGGIYYTRFVDALVGGVVGLIVMALLLPLNPLTTVQKAARQPLDMLARELTACADALEQHDLEAARAALARLRDSEPRLNALRDTLNVATETASLAPVRWRTRAPLAQYVDALVHIDRAVRNGRVLIRRGMSAVDEGEPMPAAMIHAVRTMAGSVETLRNELAGGNEPRKTRTEALDAVAQAAEAYRGGVGLSASVVFAQIRSIATDLLRATGLDDSTSTRAVRRAVGRLTT